MTVRLADLKAAAAEHGATVITSRNVPEGEAYVIEAGSLGLPDLFATETIIVINPADADTGPRND